MGTIRIATRGSKLARWQADRVADLLRAIDGQGNELNVEFVFVNTVGDQRRDVPIHELGGTGVFVKEVQQAVLDGRADIAVHSAKDLPSTTVEGLLLACVPERADVRDALVGARLRDIPNGGIVATGSVRRRAQLRAVRPDLAFSELRGNIDSRLDNAQRFDAIVLACAGIDRIGRSADIAERLEVDVMVPQIAQGALAVECRAEDLEIQTVLAWINHVEYHQCVTTERAFLAAIGGGCEAPVGAYARRHATSIELVSVIAAPNGTLHRDLRYGTDPAIIGTQAAAALLPFLGDLS